jgi:hypothetical protein
VAEPTLLNPEYRRTQISLPAFGGEHEAAANIATSRLSFILLPFKSITLPPANMGAQLSVRISLWLAFIAIGSRARTSRVLIQKMERSSGSSILAATDGKTILSGLGRD